MSSILRKIFAFLLIAVMLMSLSACKNGEMISGESKPVEMKAGMSKADITPHRDVYTGYSEGPESLAKYPDDFLTSLMARILILEVDGERILHVNVELPYVSINTFSVEFKENLAEAAGVKTENIFIGSTHNHQSNPTLDEEQEAAMIDAVKTAAENLVPVKWGVETYNTKYGVSRSPQYGQDFNMPYDNTVTVIRFDNAETNAPVGMIYCAPIHNTAYGVSGSEMWPFVNCEFTGFTSRHIEETFEDYPDFTAIHFLGFTGNSGPYFPDADRFFVRNIEELETFGGQFGDEILECYEAIACEEASDIEINTYREIYPLQKAANLTDEIKQHWGEDATVQSLLSSFSVGDVAYMEMPGEPFSTIGAHLRAESPFEYLVGITMVSNGGYFGYVPLKETFLNKYEEETKAWKTPFDETGEEQFLNAAMDLLCKLKGVTYERTMTTQTAATEQDGKRVYSFAFAEEITPDKLVLCFDQSSRLNCAEDFVLEVYDKVGNKTHTIEVNENSVNYLGFSLDDVKAATVVLTVSSTYNSKQVKDIPVTVHAMNYTPVD